MICQYCGHKLTDGKCLNPACPGTLIVHKFSLPDGKLVEIADERVWIYDGPFDYLTIDEIDVIHAEIHRNDPDLAEVEDLLDHIISAANSVSIPSESNYLNELKSRLLAALSNKGENLSGDVIVPVEELEQDLEQYITLGSTGCRTIAEDVEFNRLHSKFLAALSSGDGPVEKLEAGRYRMMIPVEISTTGGLLLDRRDGLHGYSLEDYPNARFFKGW